MLPFPFLAGLGKFGLLPLNEPKNFLFNNFKGLKQKVFFSLFKGKYKRETEENIFLLFFLSKTVLPIFWEKQISNNF